MIRKEQVTLRTLADWREHAPPKSEKHWKEGRSAAEMARTWVGLESPALPPEVDRVLRSHPDFGEVQEWSAEPEARVKFDDMGGEPSNADLLLHGHDENGAFIVVVEGKADEPFGSTVDVTLRDALERRVVNPRSRGVDRVQQLAGALFHERSGRSSPVVTSLPYQLLTATAAALAEAGRWTRWRRGGSWGPSRFPDALCSARSPTSTWGRPSGRTRTENELSHR